VKKNNQELILKTIESLLNIQIKSVSQMIKELQKDVPQARKEPMRRQSLVNNIVTILTDEARPLHVNELVGLLKERFGRVTDRDTISSALAKKARKGVLVRQTAPATFDLMKTSSHPQSDERGMSQ
jgi:hypothetical protein